MSGKFKSDAERRAAFARMSGKGHNAFNRDASVRAVNTLPDTPSNRKEWANDTRRIDLEGVDTPIVKGELPKKETKKEQPDNGINEIKVLRNEKRFFKSTADSPLWDSLFKRPEYFKEEKGLVAHLEYMKPVDYLKESIRGYDNITLDEHMEFIKKYRSKDYAEMFEKGELFPIPWFEYYEDGSRDQEGNHRAMALQILIDEGKIPPNYEMPVIIVKHISDGN